MVTSYRGDDETSLKVLDENKKGTTLQLFMEYGYTGTNMIPISTVPTDVEIGEWHHYAAVRNQDTRTVDFYVDGEKLGNTVTYSTDPTGGATSSFSIGGALFTDNTVENPFNGSIDEVRVWNAVRTQAQLRNALIFENPLPLPLLLIDFSATSKEGISTLRWITAKEVGVLKLEVEQSTDGIVFRIVKNIEAENRPGQNVHSVSLPALTNKIYYRLKMIDIDGSFNYSDVIAQGLLLRQVAAGLEMDTALLSKFERDERKPNKEQVLAFVKYYNINADELLLAWLSNKIAGEV